jgi:hypothetical protein
MDQGNTCVRVDEQAVNHGKLWTSEYRRGGDSCQTCFGAASSRNDRNGSDNRNQRPELKKDAQPVQSNRHRPYATNG